ncbi:MAG: rRNA maturation RNase YbeY [Betaproteobacteria bacterium]|nr:MAG: rRNA maturation RNase YbeY [Betaproteobacteria bacterium]TDI83042.1 MAG: rRNA maturation RNase YbeY [Betaproteobacteria bacterium]
MKLKLTLQYATDISSHFRGIPTRLQFRKWFKAGLTQDAEIVLRIVGEMESRRYNRYFCGRDYATNVLTFVYGVTLPLSGDIVLCAAVVKKEANQQHKDLIAHYAHLAVHSVLHLQGYEHESHKNAATMEQLETKIVSRLGFDDPYQES